MCLTEALITFYSVWPIWTRFWFIFNFVSKEMHGSLKVYTMTYMIHHFKIAWHLKAQMFQWSACQELSTSWILLINKLKIYKIMRIYKVDLLKWIKWFCHPFESHSFLSWISNFKKINRLREARATGLVKSLQDYRRDCSRDSLSSWRFSA